MDIITLPPLSLTARMITLAGLPKLNSPARGAVLPATPKPPDIEENFDSRKKYRRERAKVENLQKNEFRRSCRTRMTMQAVERFKDVERFYIPWSFDYRGRAYPIPAFLTPQDTDFGKSLIRSADESYITESGKKWLSLQVATTFGLDKETMADRPGSYTHLTLPTKA